MSLLWWWMAPASLMVNKVDMVTPKEVLLPRIEAYRKLGNFADVYPISAQDGDNVAELVEHLRRMMPVGTPYFPPGQISDQDENFMAEEIIREKVLSCTYREVPHAVAVKLEECRPAVNKPDQLYLKAVIYLDKPVSNSGRLKQKINEYAEDVEIEVEVEIEDAVDYILKQKSLVASGDAIILDNCDKWFNLVKRVIDENIGPFPYIDICPR